MQNPDPRTLPENLTPEGALHAPKPTRFTLFLRHFLPWQLFRFVIINLKMLRMIGKGHE